MKSIKQATIRHVRLVAIASVLSVCGLQPLVAQTELPAAGSVESQARDAWRLALSQNPASAEGCFYAEYPSLVWERAECTDAQVPVRPAPRTPGEGASAGASDVTGNGHDYALGATGLITAAQGQFPTVTNVTSEKGVGVKAFGGGGILGPNEFTLQLNSNSNATTSACAGHSGCTVWEQFVYSPDALAKGKAAVFIQYWLLGWGKKACPSGWENAVGSCVRNSASAVVPDLKITDLKNMALEAQAAAGGHDVVTFYNGTKAYSVTAKDSVVHLGSVWTEAEFNVVGNGDGSRADFNKGAKLAVLVQVHDGSSKAPRCLANAGTTGETNNLNLGVCLAGKAGSNPAIEFVESD